MSDTLYRDVRAALRTRLLATPARRTATGTLAATNPSGISGMDFLAAGLVPGEDVAFTGFGAMDAVAGTLRGVSASALVVQLATGTVSTLAGATRSVAAVLPQYADIQGEVTTPVPAPRPWWRDRLAPQNAIRQSLGAHGARIRAEGVYFLDLFFPSVVGSAAGDLWGSYLMHTRFYDGLDLTAPDTGQVVRIRSAQLAASQPSADWVLTPCTVQWRADFYTP